ncbi:UDP-N-acetylglucosamine--N-acetylmuramyl-(pentapeptide) pyrophosphoryl-undecaprenol N-acetylglucosamine transferase [Deinobacterium chartae]|uniref:UDP-N-acetylglucosamine--N-acetylmuramyl-(pentapeptide) pyrophosphoryl-undecaprenol N-acetylglucosamine transferase n=1 Tax=Deinobacterium chartae TaxID=521158 RepID=A0A841HYN6_9DEIO|nr:undecaprenyldiphospho-muramoylpentapeptide beta-N-acetylglucosaminyltransferase [Deinobacterium chartae]MBB6098003.1 UDP-N-acetylglucosamine--N-acetylmuramyl-(pentapeptide) pyrophosphoryl-undecaprenol N-acetylglucosamine transferase [Deinobacterium chartae]
MIKPTIVLSTGGTGGHIYPAVALARELEARGYATAMIGQRGGMEERIAQTENLSFHGVSAGKIDRSRPDPKQVWRAARGFGEARAFLRRLRPAAVVGFGGFASLPGVLSAQALGIPTLLHEQNARLGLTQRLALRAARVVTTAFDEVRGVPAARARKVGMPVREARLERHEALSRLNLQSGPLTVLVMGGSQGSLMLNRNVPGILEGLFGKEGLYGDYSVQVIHACGGRWLPEMAARVHDLSWYKVTGYVDAVAAWSCADFAITRAGSSTLAEAAYHGVPLLMVPLPSAAEDHQTANARAVERAGAGRMIPEAELGSALPQAVLECIPQGARTRMSEAARSLSPAGAVQRLADEVERVLRGD